MPQKSVLLRHLREVSIEKPRKDGTDPGGEDYSCKSGKTEGGRGKEIQHGLKRVEECGIKGTRKSYSGRNEINATATDWPFEEKAVRGVV